DLDPFSFVVSPSGVGAPNIEARPGRHPTPAPTPATPDPPPGQGNGPRSHRHPPPDQGTTPPA
ncbi:hypothetical protein ACFVXK_34525, partial [Streptomyces sp. NPDC058157]